MNLYNNSKIYHNLTFFEYLDVLKHDIDLYGAYVVAWFEHCYSDMYFENIEL